MNLSVDLFSPHIQDCILFNLPFGSSDYPKSPLRYPGGKARAVEIILSLIPSDIKVLVSPFLGGGSVEIALAHLGVKVLGFDIFDPLVIFWQKLLRNPDQLADEVQKYFPLGKEEFYRLQKISSENDLQIAAQFFVLNRASYSGVTLSGGMSPGHPRFTQSAINYLRNFHLPNLTVQKQDFHFTVKNESDKFLYLDPPYLIQSSLYGRNGNTHKDFDHDGLFKLLTKRGNWILSYNNSDQIKEMYKNYRILYPKWKYGMSNDKSSKEVLILSNDYPDVIGEDYA